MGLHQPQKELFRYHIDLDQRVRPDHPLRRVAATVDFTWVRAEVASCYGYNGHESVDPVILLKLMFLLFYDDLPSERELMGVVAERLDYLWFLGYGLDDPIPHHSVLSKARRRWGRAAFEQFFVRTVSPCVAAGLVDGTKLHLDSSLIAADAAKDSVIKSSPALIAALKQAYQAQESKLDDTQTPEDYEAINDRHVSRTDPDAALARKGGEPARPSYHHHRAVDDAHGVITAVETTPGSIAENKKLGDLIAQHEANTQIPVETVVGDSKYGTVENYVTCQQREITPHLGDALARQGRTGRRAGIYPDSAFTYQPQANTYRCPVGQTLVPRRLHPQRRTWEYYVPGRGCLRCALRAQCTRSQSGRTLRRHEQQELLDRARAQAHSAAGVRDRQRRQVVMEGSFADAANNHGFKRARWRRLWRQEIQDWLIAGIQNIRLLLQRAGRRAHGAGAALKETGAEVLCGRRARLGCWIGWENGRRGWESLTPLELFRCQGRVNSSLPLSPAPKEGLWATGPQDATPEPTSFLSVTLISIRPAAG